MSATEADFKREQMRQEVRRRLRERREARERLLAGQIGPAPRYDAVFYEGVAWLDRLARGEEE